MAKIDLTYVELNPYRCSNLYLNNRADNTYQTSGAPILLEEDSRRLAESFRELFSAVSVDCKKGWTHVLTMAERGTRMNDDWDFVVPTKFALSFLKMYQELSESTSNIHKDGLETGKSLLIGLNNGTITLNDFNNNLLK